MCPSHRGLGTYSREDCGHPTLQAEKDTPHKVRHNWSCQIIRLTPHVSRRLSRYTWSREVDPDTRMSELGNLPFTDLTAPPSALPVIILVPRYRSFLFPSSLNPPDAWSKTTSPLRYQHAVVREDITTRLVRSIAHGL